MSRLSEMTLEDALNEYEDGFCVLVDDGKRIALTNSDEEYYGIVKPKSLKHDINLI